LDIKNKRAFDVLAKEVFFSRGCVLVEGYEDAHLLERYFAEISKGTIEIFGYGSGGADGINAWLIACADLQIPAVGLFDGDAKGNAAIATARKRFEHVETIKVLQIPAPDIRDKHKLAVDCRTETPEIEKEGVFTRNWVLKDQYKDAMAALVSEIASFLHASDDVPSLSPPT
jgi:predicted ATP-dependent endonuclease of OLD family